jgi:hypothetical protein
MMIAKTPSLNASIREVGISPTLKNSGKPFVQIFLVFSQLWFAQCFGVKKLFPSKQSEREILRRLCDPRSGIFLGFRSTARSATPEPTLPGPRPQPIANGQSQRGLSGQTRAYRPHTGRDALSAERFPRSARRLSSSSWLTRLRRRERRPPFDSLEVRALVGHRPEFNRQPVFQGRALFGNLQRFI